MKVLGILFLFGALEIICFKLAGLYLSTAKSLGANMFRPKDVMGPYFTAFMTGLIITGYVAFLWIESENNKKE